MTPRFLANENFLQPSVTVLRQRGYDVFAVAEVLKGLSDQNVLALACRDERWILTFDRDYRDLIDRMGLPTPPAVIYLQLASCRPEDPRCVLVDLMTQAGLLAGHFVVVEEQGLRKRPLPAT